MKPSFRIQAALNVLVESRPNATPPDLRDCDLRGARLRGAYLSRASFRRSYLYKAKLTDAHLMEASLVEADLAGADLTGAVFTDADMRCALVTVGALTPEQLKSVKNQETIEWIAATAPTSQQPMADSGPEPL